MPYIKIRGPSPPIKLKSSGLDPPNKTKYIRGFYLPVKINYFSSGLDPPLEGEVRICLP